VSTVAVPHLSGRKWRHWYGRRLKPSEGPLLYNRVDALTAIPRGDAQRSEAGHRTSGRREELSDLIRSGHAHSSKTSSASALKELSPPWLCGCAWYTG
jgi:hypothetical protein